MYAVVELSGKQHKVEVDQTLDIDLQKAEKGSKITFENVLLLADGDNVQIGQPYLENASVTAEFIDIVNSEKLTILIFITTFTTIFIAELGDKTQIATLMLSAESGRPIIVFLGSSLALISSSIVGVLIGKWVSKKISPSKFALSTGTLMILISIFLAYETFKNYL